MEWHFCWLAAAAANDIKELTVLAWRTVEAASTASRTVAFAVAAGISLWWGRKLDLMIYGCDHKAELIDEAFVTEDEIIVIRYVCDDCGTRRQVRWNRRV